MASSLSKKDFGGLNAYIVEALRSPIGRSHAEKGAFRNLRADELLAQLIKAVAAKLPSPALIDDVYAGCVGQHLEQGKNIARLASLIAGLPNEVPGTTINRLCASSLQAFHFAASTLNSGQANILLAGGVEHMHHVPMAAAIDYSQELLARFEFPFTQMGLTAERVAERYGVTRSDQDEFARQSHDRALAAQKSHHFDKEILPITTPDGVVKQDQGPRAGTTMQTLGELKTVFKEGGTVTAGNSSPLSDGASLTLVATKEACADHGLRIRAQVVELAVVGLDPLMMGMGPVPAIQKLLKHAGLTISDIDLFEINEAFASQALACVRELEIPLDKVNPFGGAIALGHPLGCTGTRLITTLLNGMEARNAELGVAALCVGHGQGLATLIRRTHG